MSFNRFNTSNGPAIYKSDGNNVGTKIYQGKPMWKIQALTSGDFNNNGKDELITGFNSSNGPAIYKSDGNNIGTKNISRKNRT